MWKLLPILAILAYLILTVASARATHTKITVENKAQAGSIAEVDSASCGNDKNSTFGCGVNCGRRCSNYDTGPVKCAETCYANSCDCKKGYVFDDYRGYCVKPEDCSNRDAPKPEGTEGTPGNGEDEDTDTTPCDDCDEDNCDVQDTTNMPDGGENTCTIDRGDEAEGTEDPNNGSTSTTAGGSENSTTPQGTNRTKRTITTSSADSSSTIEESGGDSTPNNENEDENMTGSGSESTTGPFGMETTSEGPGMETEIHKHKKKRKTTTPASTGGPGSSTEEPAMTTEGSGLRSTTGGSEITLTSDESGSEATTGSTGVEKPIHKHKKKHRTTTLAYTGSPGSSSEELKMTTEGSLSQSTTDSSEMTPISKESGSGATIGSTRVEKPIHKHKKKHRTTTPASTGSPGTSTEELKMTTEGSLSQSTTGSSETTPTTEESGSEATTGSPGVEKPTHKHKKKHRTTTPASTGSPDSSTEEPKITTEGSGSQSATGGSETTPTSEESGSGATTRSPGVEKLTHKHKKKHKTTTPASTGSPDSSTEEPKMTTEGSGSQSATGGSETTPTSEESGSEATTGSPGVEKLTHKHKKKHRTTTPASTGGPGSSTEEPKMTTEGSGSQSTTGGSETTPKSEESGSGATTGSPGVEKPTHKHKKKLRTTTPASTGGPGSSTEEPDMTTEGSGKSETGGCETTPKSEESGSEATTGSPGVKKPTHKHKKKHRTTTPASTGSPGTSTEESIMTTEGSKSQSMTGCSEITTGSSEMETKTTEDNTNSTNEEKSSSNEASTTTKKQRTATQTTSGTNTHRPRTTKKPRPSTTLQPKRTKTQRTTTKLVGETTTERSETTTNTDGSDGTTTTDDSGNTTTTMTTTDGQTTTMKGPNDCKGRNEWYFLCAPLCPQKTCADYLNGVKCPIITGLPKCKPECRCLIGYYKDDEGNCLSTWECRRRARSTTNVMASSTTTMNPRNQDTTASSSTTMMFTTPKPNCEDVAKELFIIGNLGYTTKLLTDLSQREPGNNILVGGASILYLFGQLVMGAKDELKTEILNVLNLENTEQVSCFLPKMSAKLTAPYPDIQYSLFCKIYADSEYALTNDFIQRTTQLFGMGPENLNFNSSEAAQKINNDVAQYTNDSFLNFVKTNTLSQLDGLVLTDAEHFQGKWEKQFDPKDTVMKDFFWQGRVDKIPFMHNIGWFLFADSPLLGAKILKLKYRGGRFTLIIILPYSLDGISDLLRRMENPQNTASAFDSLKYEYVEISLPKFKISVANRLKMSSEMANINEIFNNATTGLEDIGSGKPPYVSDILQKMAFEVNEMGMGDKLDPEFIKGESITSHTKIVFKKLFKADHPYLFALCFDKLVLQIGLFAH